MFRPIRMDHTNCLQVAIKTLHIAIAKSAESDSGKKSRLTALLLWEENQSLLECFRGEGQWHGHGAEAHFEGAPNWRVVIAKFESFSEMLRLSEHDCTPAAGSVSTPGTSESS